MGKKKDYFSAQSAKYAQFRPQYPEALYRYIYQHVRSFENALDTGTGNGQVAHVLSKKFKNIKAIDISAPQVAHAFKEDIFNTVWVQLRVQDSVPRLLIW